MYHLSIRVARADAVFVSALQRSAQPTAGQVRRAVAETVRAFGSRGCAARVAQEFGDRPETATARMRWARTVADQAFGTRRAPVRGEALDTVEALGAGGALGTSQVPGTAGALGTAGMLGTAAALTRAEALRAGEAQPGRAPALARYPVAARGRAA
jgi:hypothetical protein